jgi:hypothetical protein
MGEHRQTTWGCASVKETASQFDLRTIPARVSREHFLKARRGDNSRTDGVVSRGEGSMLIGQRYGSIGLLIAFVGNTAAAQEMGAPQTYGTDGRLFSAGTIDYFLLSRRSYLTEDSSGYEGQVRAVRKYPGGGYEIKLKDFTARCIAPFDNIVQIAWSDPAQQGSKHVVPVKNPAKFPRQDAKESYNLYWAACRNVFQKFK